MMKRNYFCGIFATLFVTTTIFLLASCSQDDDYYDSDMYTLAEMGTRLAEGGEGGDPGIGDNGLEQNTRIPGEENCCGLYTLTARSIEMYGKDAFISNGLGTELTAKGIYEKIRQYTINHPELNWKPGDASMSLSTIMTLANVFKVHGKPLFSEVREFSSLGDVQAFLNVKKNREKIKAVVMEELKPDGKLHIAPANVCNNYINFDGYNYLNKNYDGGKVYYNSVLDKDGYPKNGKDCNNQPYKIIGVLLQ